MEKKIVQITPLKFSKSLNNSLNYFFGSNSPTTMPISPIHPLDVDPMA